MTLSRRESASPNVIRFPTSPTNSLQTQILKWADRRERAEQIRLRLNPLLQCVGELCLAERIPIDEVTHAVDEAMLRGAFRKSKSVDDVAVMLGAKTSYIRFLLRGRQSKLAKEIRNRGGET